MNSRPKIKISLSTPDLFIEVLGWVLLVALWTLILLHFKNLPEQIPTHFNTAGKIDQYGKKGTVIHLPVVATILFLLMTFLNKYPHIYNYPTEITEDNALTQYTMGTRMIRYLKLVIVIIFSLITLNTFNSQELNALFLPLTIAVLTIPTIVVFIKSMRAE